MNTNTAKFLFEGIFVKLEDFSTGLYIESPAYVYDLLMSELKNGKLVQ